MGRGGGGVACQNVPVARWIDSLVWATARDRSSPEGAGACPTPFPQSPSCTGARWTGCHYPRRVKVEPARGSSSTLAHGLVSK